MTLTSVVEPAAVTESADFDGDGDVDGADFLTWQLGFDAPGSLATGDVNDDQLVDAADLAIWKGQYGNDSAPLHAVPEQAAAGLATMVALLGCCASRRRSTVGRAA